MGLVLVRLPPVRMALATVPCVGLLLVRLPLAPMALGLVPPRGLPTAQVPRARTLLARMALARPGRVLVRVRVGVLPMVWAVVVRASAVCGRRGWWWGRFVRWPKSWR
ncbi:hypothetical protein [Microbispora hainanensis]|uniref:hypothetical protein n=1 Tax=Microbispora hainanensis TaxID=568844 RepID=UPI0032488D34